MRKIIIFSILAIAGTFVSAQNILNPGFESWNEEILFEYPSNFLTTNLQLAYTGLKPNVTKSEDAHGGSYAVRLETVVARSDTVFGGIFAGDPKDPNFNVFGGIFYSDKPDSITGYAKFDIKPLDTAIILVLFKRMGFPLGLSISTFTGSQSDYTYFSAPVSWFSQPFTPDSIVVVIASSNINSVATPGSILYLDDINFIKNNGVVAKFPNGDFESWGSLTTDEPEGWFTLNFSSFWSGKPSATKTFDAYSGDYALRLENIEVFNDTLGFITNGYLSNNDYPLGGFRLEENPKTLTGYYKYMPVGPDTALAGGFHYRQNGSKTDLIELKIIQLPPVANYTKFTIDFTYDKYPVGDTLNLSFGAGNFFEDNNYVGLGSVLYLDNLELTFKPNSIDEQEHTIPLKIFPNPSNGQFTVVTPPSLPENNLLIVDESGKEVLHQKVFSSTDIDISHLGKGVYYVKIGNKAIRKIIVNQ